MAIAALVLAGSLCVPSARASEGDAAPARLAEPGGPHAVGESTLHLEDPDRPDPWVPGEHRELMVSVWYPAKKPSGTPAPYMTAAESRQYLESAEVPLPPETLSAVRTHATVDAAPATTPEGWPLVLLSPGYGMPRATLSGLAEELASRGYVVAGVGHNHEAYGTTFPDGHTTGCEMCESPDDTKAGDTRAADMSLVLDALTGDGEGRGPRAPAWRHAGLVDSGRVAMAGHSAGGFSTVPAMLRDARIKAGVNMDGNFRYPNDVPLKRPMLLLGKPSHVPGDPADPSWDETWGELTGWKRWLSVDDTEHLSFTDVAPLGEQLGIPGQELDGTRCDVLVRAYVTAFVDRHLKGRDAPLLDGPSPGNPEVRFHLSEG